MKQDLVLIAKELAKKWYTEEYYSGNLLELIKLIKSTTTYREATDSDKQILVATGYCNSLLENADISYQELVDTVGVTVAWSVFLLTQSEDETYDSYINLIKTSYYQTKFDKGALMKTSSLKGDDWYSVKVKLCELELVMGICMGNLCNNVDVKYNSVMLDSYERAYRYLLHE